jgi:hypothetical protein
MGHPYVASTLSHALLFPSVSERFAGAVFPILHTWRSLQDGVSGDHTQNGKTNHNRKFTGPHFTCAIFGIQPTALKI